MVYRKQLNEDGDYIGQDGLRYEIRSCHASESKEWYDTGEVDEQGEPIYDWRIVINKGWDEFPSEEAAAAAYGLMYDPLPIEGELDNEETVG